MATLYWHNLRRDGDMARRDNYTTDQAGSFAAAPDFEKALKNYYQSFPSLRNLYIFNNDVLPTINDEQGNDNATILDGTLTGSSLPSNEISNALATQKAYQASGPVDAIRLPTSFTNWLNGRDRWTFSFYFEWDGTTPSNAQTLFQIGDSNDGFHVMLTAGTKHVEALAYAGGVSQLLTTGASVIAANTTYRVDITFDNNPAAGGQTTIKVYLDGVQDASVSTAPDAQILPPITQNGTFAASEGGWAVSISPPDTGTGYANPYYGQLDTVAFFGEVLDPRIISLMHTIGTGVGHTVDRPEFRYYRLNIPSKQGGDLGAGIYQWTLYRNPASGFPLPFPSTMSDNTTPSPFVASSYDSSPDAYRVFDNDSGTSYRFNDPNAWLQIDLGSSVAVDEWVTDWRSGIGREITYMVLEGSDDSVTWTRIGSQFSGLTGLSSRLVSPFWNDILRWDGTGVGSGDSGVMNTRVQCQAFKYPDSISTPWLIDTAGKWAVMSTTEVTDFADPQLVNGRLDILDGHSVTSRDSSGNSTGQFYLAGTFRHFFLGDTTYDGVFLIRGRAAVLEVANGNISGRIRGGGGLLFGENDWVTILGAFSFIEVDTPTGPDLGRIILGFGSTYRMEASALGAGVPTANPAGIVRAGINTTVELFYNNSGIADSFQDYDFLGNSTFRIEGAADEARNNGNFTGYTGAIITLVESLTDPNAFARFTENARILADGTSGDFEIVVDSGEWQINPGLSLWESEHGNTTLRNGSLFGFVFPYGQEPAGVKDLDLGQGTITVEATGGELLLRHYLSDTGYTDTPSNILGVNNDIVVDGPLNIVSDSVVSGDPATRINGAITLNHQLLVWQSLNGGNGQQHWINGPVTIKNDTGTPDQEFVIQSQMGGDQDVLVNADILLGSGSDNNFLVLLSNGQSSGEGFSLREFADINGQPYPRTVVRDAEIHVRDGDGIRYIPELIVESTGRVLAEITLQVNGVHKFAVGSQFYFATPGRDVQYNVAGPHELFCGFRLSDVDDATDTRFIITQAGTVFVFDEGQRASLAVETGTYFPRVVVQSGDLTLQGQGFLSTFTVQFGGPAATDDPVLFMAGGTELTVDDPDMLVRCHRRTVFGYLGGPGVGVINGTGHLGLTFHSSNPTFPSASEFQFDIAELSVSGADFVGDINPIIDGHVITGNLIFDNDNVPIRPEMVNTTLQGDLIINVNVAGGSGAQEPVIEDSTITGQIVVDNSGDGTGDHVLTIEGVVEVQNGVDINTTAFQGSFSLEGNGTLTASQDSDLDLTDITALENMGVTLHLQADTTDYGTLTLPTVDRLGPVYPPLVRLTNNTGVELTYDGGSALTWGRISTRGNAGTVLSAEDIALVFSTPFDPDEPAAPLTLRGSNPATAALTLEGLNIDMSLLAGVEDFAEVNFMANPNMNITGQGGKYVIEGNVIFRDDVASASYVLSGDFIVRDNILFLRAQSSGHAASFDQSVGDRLESQRESVAILNQMGDTAWDLNFDGEVVANVTVSFPFANAVTFGGSSKVILDINQEPPGGGVPTRTLYLNGSPHDLEVYLQASYAGALSSLQIETGPSIDERTITGLLTVDNLHASKTLTFRQSTPLMVSGVDISDGGGGGMVYDFNGFDLDNDGVTDFQSTVGVVKPAGSRLTLLTTGVEQFLPPDAELPPVYLEHSGTVTLERTLTAESVTHATGSGEFRVQGNDISLTGTFQSLSGTLTQLEGSTFDVDFWFVQNVTATATAPWFVNSTFAPFYDGPLLSYSDASGGETGTIASGISADGGNNVNWQFPFIGAGAGGEEFINRLGLGLYLGDQRFNNG